jgi:hypothetical protein
MQKKRKRQQLNAVLEGLYLNVRIMRMLDKQSYQFYLGAKINKE